MIQRLVQSVQKTMAAVDRLTLRERLFLLAALLVVLAGAWQALLQRPLELRQRAAEQHIADLKQRLNQLGETVAVTAKGLDAVSASDLERLRALRERVADGQKASRLYASDLVDPDQMRFVLEDLLRRQTGLKLVSVANLDVAPVLAKEQKARDETEAASGPRLYRHTFVLTLEGPYLDCLRYLEAVERLPWQLYWSRLELEAETYPLNKIVIEVNTLSLDKEWIGV